MGFRGHKVVTRVSTELPNTLPYDYIAGLYGSTAGRKRVAARVEVWAGALKELSLKVLMVLRECGVWAMRG